MIKLNQAKLVHAKINMTILSQAKLIMAKLSQVIILMVKINYVKLNCYLYMFDLILFWNIFS